MAKKKQYSNPFINIKKNSDPVSLYNKAVVLKKNGQLKAALESYELAISLKPDFVEAYYNMGNILRELGEFENAIICFDICIKLKPDFSFAYFNRGNIYKSLQRLYLALKDYENAIEINPLYSEAFSNKGLVLKDLKKYDQALSCLNSAIDSNPNLAEAYSNKGNLLQERDDYEGALDNYNKAISLNPNAVDYLVNKGILLMHHNRLELALETLEEALKIKPDAEGLLGLILRMKIFLCDWSNFDKNLVLCESEIKKNKFVIQPFITAMLYDNAELQGLSSLIYSKIKFPFKCELGAIPKRSEEQKLKIGYFSTDLYYHPVSIWLAEQLENHDKSKFELYAFCLKEIKDPMQERLKSAFDHWIVVDNMSDLEVTLLSRELKIDIALDLNGHTQNCRTNIFARRAAPIQVSHLGMPGTMGASYIDYIISDSFTLNQKNISNMTENVAFVPCGYTYDRQRLISDKPLSRNQFGLPEKGFVFTCQNGCHKFTPEVFGIWMDVLNALPESVLWLLKPGPTAEQNLMSKAAEYGVNPARLIFTARESLPIEMEAERIGRYLASYKLADLFLDTWPYNAGTTAIDALWAGLPVLTKSGESFVSRMATSALNAIEIQELITHSANDYRNLAIELATDSKKLDLIKAKLQKNKFTTALFDSVTNTRHIESAYLEMHRKYLNGQQPASFSIDK